MNASVEVFRDLYLRGPLSRRLELKKALISEAKDPWYYDPDRTGKIARNAATDDDVLIFGRKKSSELKPASLSLWGDEDGYYVPNIVPIDAGELGVAQYNAILADFIENVAKPVASQFDYRIDATKARQDLEDWTSAEAAQKLRAFSSAANKSTGATHPMDRRRWFDFVIAVHKSRRIIGTDRLFRWLYEVDHWDRDSAHALTGDYETALGLLKRYDER